MALDHQTAWTELGAYVASRPNHGRQDLLSEMARIAQRNTLPEEDMQRALRLVLPSFVEMLFDRLARVRGHGAAEPVLSPEEAPDGDHAAADRPSMAAV